MKPATPPRVSGSVRSGLGQGRMFTQLPWARKQFISKLGIEPYPGTLNLEVSEDRATWERLKQGAGILIKPPTDLYCLARAYPVRVEGQWPAAVVVPQVPDYRDSQVELISPLPLRSTLSLEDGRTTWFELNRPLRVRGVIFDLDGTLLDSLEAFRVCAARAAAPLKIPITWDMVRRPLTSQNDFWETVLPSETANRQQTLDRLHRDAQALLPQALREFARPYPGVVEILRRLNRRFTLGLFTGSSGVSIGLLKPTGLFDPFEVMITSGDIASAKPDPEGLSKCLTGLQLQPQEAVYVGDSPLDIQTSHAAGVSAIGVLTGCGTSEVLARERPDWIIQSVSDLPRVLETP